jgi:hypothetical protein
MDIDVQTFYSTVNNSMSNVVHNRISSTEFKLPMCRNNLMSCSSSIPIEAHSSWCWNIFHIFYMWMRCRQLQFLFHDRTSIMFWPIFKILTKQLFGLAVQCTSRAIENGAIQASHATLCGVTPSGSPEPRTPMAWVVTPPCVARLHLDLLSTRLPWCD